VGDIGFTELLVIALVAVLVLGPDKLPELAKQAAAILRKARDFSRAARDELRTELGDAYADLELRDLDPRAIVRKHLAEAMEDPGKDHLRARRPGQRPLAAGQPPPNDTDAT
jgi:sec-independent protein translocase protein TatB